MNNIPKNVKELPILMNGEMVRAILSGQKVQTRRPVTLRDFGPTDTPGYDFCFRDRRWLWNDFTAEKLASRCPYGKPGDILWVRERWATDANVDALPPRMIPQKVPIYCHATAQCQECRWRPSIHMPRWASRITLEVTGVRVQRLQDISEEDLVAEGIQKSMGGKWCGKSHKAHGFLRQHNTAKEAFADLWDSIYARRGLGGDANPWVWAITFRRVA